MRKIYIFALAIFMASAACTKREEAAKFENESKTIVLQGFTSPDRAFADVRGDAVKCTIVTTDMEQSGDTLVPATESLVTTLTQTFDHNGHIVSVRQDDEYMQQRVGSSAFKFEFDSIGSLVSSATDLGGRFRVNRDKDGYVTAFTSISSTGDVDYTKLYKWTGGRLVQQEIASDHHPVDSDGKPIPQPKDVAKYAYDDAGYLVSVTEESGDPSLQINITTTEYKYNDRDSLGNWTDRNVTRTAKVYDVRGGKRTMTDSIVTYQKEQRTVCY